MDKPHLIHLNSDRKNIYYYVKKTKVGDLSCFDWLIQQLSFEGEECPKAIIYCRNVVTVSKVYAHFLNVLKDNAYKSDLHKYDECFIAMFHRGTASLNKSFVSCEFPKLNSTLRVVVATSAFGLGVDIADVKTVINYGCPRSLKEFVQQSGRAGRNGDQAFSVLYYQPQNVSSKCTDAAFKTFVKAEKCRREIILRNFCLSGVSPGHTEVSELCKCCDMCSRNCVCGNDHSSMYAWEADVIPDNDLLLASENMHAIHRVTDDDKTFLLEINIREHHMDILESFSCENLLVSPEISLGYSIDVLISKIISNYQYIVSVEDIVDETGITDSSLAADILDLIEEIYPLAN